MYELIILDAISGLSEVLKPLYHNSYKRNVNMLIHQSPVNRILYMN